MTRAKAWIRRTGIIFVIAAAAGCQSRGDTTSDLCAHMLNRISECLTPPLSSSELEAIEDQKCPDNLGDLDCDVASYYRCIERVLDRNECDLDGVRLQCSSPCAVLLEVDPMTRLLCPIGGSDFSSLLPTDESSEEDDFVDDGEEVADGDEPPADLTLDVSPPELVFTHTVGETLCPQEIGAITVRNANSVPLDYGAFDDSDQLETSFTTFSLAPGASQSIIVFFNCSRAADVSGTVSVQLLESGAQSTTVITGDVEFPE